MVVAILSTSYHGPVPDRDNDWSESDLPFVDQEVARPLRRTGPFIRRAVNSALACMSAYETWQDIVPKLGIFIGSGLGNGIEISDFFRSLYSRDMAGYSPISFANSVGNAAGFYIAKSLGASGPCITCQSEELSFESAIMTAQASLRTGGCEYALVGGTDVFHPPKSDMLRRLNLPVDEGRRLGESAGWLLLTLNPCGGANPVLSEVRYGRVNSATDLVQLIAALPNIGDTEKSVVTGYRLTATELGWVQEALGEAKPFVIEPITGIHPTMTAAAAAIHCNNRGPISQFYSIQKDGAGLWAAYTLLAARQR